MRRKKGLICIILGLLLFAAAIALYIHNSKEDVQAMENAHHIVSKIQTIILDVPRAVPLSEPKPSSAPVPSDDTIENVPSDDTNRVEPSDGMNEVEPSGVILSPEMPVMEIDGYGYIGLLSIPGCGLDLPIMAEWDYNRLKIAPCRQFGSTRTDDIVIAAHNYDSHFGSLKDLPIGEVITITDMEGIVNRYTLKKQEILSPANVDAVKDSGYPLVLYTCTKGGAKRVALFFSKESAG